MRDGSHERRAYSNGGRSARFSAWSQRRRGGARERFGRFVVPTLAEPLEVWLSPPTTQAGTPVYRRRFVAVFDEDGAAKGHLAVAQENKDGSLLWTTYRHGRIDSVREGRLLYRREE